MSSNERTSRFTFSWKIAGIIVGALLSIAAALLLLFYILFVDHIDQHQFGYKVERMEGGKLTIIAKKGYVVTPPLVTKVYEIDTRPEQRCIRSGRASVNQRVLNCKLVAFNPEGLDEFIKLHGVQTGNVTDILEPYAFDQLARPYPFLIIKDSSGPMVEQKKGGGSRYS